MKTKAKDIAIIILLALFAFNIIITLVGSVFFNKEPSQYTMFRQLELGIVILILFKIKEQ